MSFFATESNVGRPDDLLRLARETVDSDVQAIADDPATPISCKPQCSVCCHQMVPVTAAELRSIYAAVEAMPEPQRSDVRGRIVDAADRLVDEGFTSDFPTAHEPDERRALAQRYFELKVMCPLLEDGVCGVRPVRPLVCREYVVTSDPVHCATLDTESVVRIRPRRNVLRGFVEVSREFNEPAIQVLALALAETPPEVPAPRPVSGPAAVQLLTSFRLDPAGETGHGAPSSHTDEVIETRGEFAEVAAEL